MSKSDLLTLVVALSAYLAAVRLAVIGRLGSQPPPKHPKTLKWFIVLLIPADASLVFGGLLLTADIFWKDLFCVEPTTRLYTVAVWLFAFAIFYLAIHHLVSWGISAKKLIYHKNATASGQDQQKIE